MVCCLLFVVCWLVVCGLFFCMGCLLVAKLSFVELWYVGVVGLLVDCVLFVACWLLFVVCRVLDGCWLFVVWHGLGLRFII